METVHTDPHVSTKQFCSQTLLVHSASWTNYQRDNLCSYVPGVVYTTNCIREMGPFRLDSSNQLTDVEAEPSSKQNQKLGEDLGNPLLQIT